MRESAKVGGARADAIVIGAGAFGCNAAWHLAKRGQRVVLLEAEEAPATQASRAAAGFISSWSIVHQPSWQVNEWQMQRYGLKFYTQLAKTCGRDIGYFPCGIVYIYLTDDAWRDVQPRIEQARAVGTQLEVLTAERAAAVIPQIIFDETTGIIFDPDSIRIRAAEAIAALAEQLPAMGVTVSYGTPVTDFIQQDGEVRGVVAGGRSFHASNVIIAAGAWSRPLLSRLGIANPAVPKTETRYTTKPLPGVSTNMPLTIWADCHWFYMREEQGGMLIGGFENDPLPSDRVVDPENPPRSQDFQDVTKQPHRVREFVRDVEHVMPLLERAEVDKALGGLPTFTGDDLFIAGVVPGIDGLYIMAACQEGGVTHGPGLGKMISELIVDGQSDWDRPQYHLERFETSNL